MKPVALILFCLLTSGEVDRTKVSGGTAVVSSAKSAIKLKPQYDLEHGLVRGRCSISVKQDDGTHCTHLRAMRGEKLTLDIRFQTTAGGYFYNPSFNRLIPFPGNLTIFDSEERCLDVLSWRRGARFAGPPDESDWRFISNGYVGAGCRIVAGRLPAADVHGKSNDLPPGKYYIQMIYRERFVLPKGSRPALVEKASGELFRSNIIELEVVEGKEKAKEAHKDVVDRSCSCGPEDSVDPDRLRVEMRGQYDLKKGPLRGRCTLLFRRDQFGGYNLTMVPRGTKLDIDIRFQPTADGDFYNPFFNDQIPLPGHLTIFRSDGEYLGLLTEWCKPSPSREPQESDWHRLSDGYVGTTRSIIAGHIPCGHFLGKPYDLPPGQYIIQMIFRDRFVLPRTSDPAEVRAASGELFRSDYLELIIEDEEEEHDPDQASAK